MGSPAGGDDDKNSKAPSGNEDGEGGIEVNQTEAKKNAAHAADLRQSLSSSAARKTPPGQKTATSKSSPSSARRDNGQNKKSSQYHVHWEVNRSSTQKTAQQDDSDEDSITANDDAVDYLDDDSVPPAARWPAFRGSSKDYWDESSSSDEEDLFQ